MMAPLMLYIVAVTSLCGIAGILLDRVWALRRYPRRILWATLLVVSLLWPTVAHFIPPSPPVVALSGGGDGQISAPLRWVVLADGVRSDIEAGIAAATSLNAPLAFAWLLTSVTMLALFVAGRVALARRKRQWRPTVIEDTPVLLAPGVGPAVVGLVTPAIVLPDWVVTLDDRSLALVLRHKREHVRAGDPWLIHLAAIALAAMPWNPAIWWLAARLRLAVEIDCDARVIGSGVGAGNAAATYSELLLAVAARPGLSASGMSPALIESTSMLARRISAMFPTKTRFGRMKATAAALTAATVGVIAVALPAPRLEARNAAPALAPQPPVAIVRPVPAANPRSETSVTTRRVATTATPSSQAVQPQPPAPPAPRPFGAGAMRLGQSPSLINPEVLRQVNPAYTPAAMAQKIAGRVVLEAVIGTDGRVEESRIIRSLDTEYGLDQQAQMAVDAWTFKPATLDGRAVPMIVQIEMEFTLR